ncbi:MAG: hypothetical protein L0215_04690 [Gemmataceae bacterium]|nr:hypothetical protein [Gemmataceae bacterium]
MNPAHSLAGRREKKTDRMARVRRIRPLTLLVLDPHAKAALNAHGNGKVNVPNAPILVNSDHATAAVTSSGGTVLAPEFDITGGYSGTGFTGPMKTGVAPPPIRALSAPARSCHADSAKYETVFGLRRHS